MEIELITTADPDFKRDLDKFLEGVSGVVEATDCERYYIYEEHLKHGGAWEENNKGIMCGVGKLAGMPVTLSLWTAKLNGQKILFVDSPSQVVDHRMIDKWMDENLPPSARDAGGINKTDATNYHNVLRRPAGVAA